MKTLGLIGGMTWHSTVDYYRLINADVQKRLGGSSSARLVLYSVEFQEFEDCQEAGNWVRLTELMTDAALRVQTVSSRPAYEPSPRSTTATSPAWRGECFRLSPCFVVPMRTS